ncbi:MAG: CHASE2 domain-containing protein [Deltaproteobacteria bacterium]|nr:CHASE2 domain-containing protein [Deltaproteobacteria bacterium]
MTINKNRNLQITILLVLGSFVAAHLCFWLLPGVFETWNYQAVDRLFSFRSSSERLVPAYDNTIVHVDLTNSTIQRLNNFYLNRSHYAQVARNLTAMNVSAQLYDFIFAARTNDKEDSALIEATKKAGNVYYGLAFKLLAQEVTQRKSPGNIKNIEYLDRTKWHVAVKGDPKGLYVGANPLITFSALASASKGLGCLSLDFDHDGVFRRMPLLVRYKDAFYPSFSFRAICDYLGVPPEKIVVRPGKTITLKDAKRPGKEAAHDIIIPIDRYGNMVINFVGPWERMKHYNFADVLRASDDRDEMEMWEEELSGKIVVVSQVSTGSSDVGPVPTDTQFPLSG